VRFGEVAVRLRVAGIDGELAQVLVDHRGLRILQLDPP